ncbi:MAG: transposase [Sedimentisphaerales bacterium]
MTDCNTQPLLFSNLKNKKIQADFNGGSLTSDAGAVLLREVDNRIGLINAINRCIPDPRHPFFIVHDQKTMLAQTLQSDIEAACAKDSSGMAECKDYLSRGQRILQMETDALV